MSTLLLSLSVSIAFTLPGAKLPDSANLADTDGTANQRIRGDQIICQRYGDSDPHGSDPHGRDPHDEVHDSGLPANAAEDRRVATDNVYGGTTAGKNSQHPLDNFPGQPGF